MGVKKYRKGTRDYWQLDIWITFPDGRRKRLKKAGIETREMAEALEHKWKSDAFEGRYFNRPQASTLTIRKAWENYKPVSYRGNKHSTYKRNLSISKHLLEHLGNVRIAMLTQRHIDEYRTRREAEPTRFKAPPKPGTVNREVALLKRILNYAVKRGDTERNPLSCVEMLEEDNVRQVAISEAQFVCLYEAADDFLRPILVAAYETGMRRGEILELKWGQVDLVRGTARLANSDTKSKKPRVIALTDRVLEELRHLPHFISGYVFANPDTGKRWYDLKKMFDRARKKARLEHIRFHDLRRSFVTNARKRGVPESVVMKMSGHKTRSVFERYNVIDEEDLMDAVRRIENGRCEELAALEKTSDDEPSEALKSGGEQ